MNDLLRTKKQAAALLGVSVSTIKKWMRVGGLPFSHEGKRRAGRRESRRVVFSRSALLRWYGDFSGIEMTSGGVAA